MFDDAVSMRPGDVVAGRYRVEELVGQGGYGIVWKATDLQHDRVVALKMLLAPTLAQEEGRARFRREAELAQKLEHPNTVRLLDFGATDAGAPFIAWEYLKGRALDAVLATEGRLAPARVARIAAQTLRALKEAHDKGIVHRDIKPSNIFLCDAPGEPDVVKVLDFGIAKDTFVRGTGLTPEGSILGTPAYMAPEQVRGRAITAVADLYALGLVMAELCTGLPVYPGLVPLEVVTAQLSNLPVPLPLAVTESPLGPIIARATEKRVEARFAAAADMLTALEGVMESPALALAPLAPGGAAVTVAPAQVRIRERPLALAETAAATMARPDRPPPTLIGDDPPPPPPSRAPGVASEPPVPQTRGSRPSVVLVAIGAGAALVGSAIAVLVYVYQDRSAAAGPAPPRPSAPTAVPAPAPPAPAPIAKHFAHLSNRQILSRIEAAGYKVLEEKPGDSMTVFVLASGHHVRIIHLSDVRAAEATEQSYLKQGGATARDGTAVLHVDLHPAAAARSLLDHIAR
jgi:serine/threonine protein kinase